MHVKWKNTLKLTSIFHGLLLALVALPLQASPNTIGPVTSKDTLWSLAQKARGDEKYSMYQVMVALYQKNPQAFIGHNIHHVQQGAHLLLPSASEIAAINAEQAAIQVENDERAWQQWRAQQKASPRVHSSQRRQTSNQRSSHTSRQATQALIAQVGEQTAPPSLSVIQTPTPAGSDTKSESSAHKPPIRQQATVEPFWQPLQLNHTLSLDWREFAKPGLQGQDKNSSSGSLLQEWYWLSTNEQHAVALTPYLRLDSRDQERHLMDLRQAYWHFIQPNWDLKIGVDQLFWGVTESLHLVDVVNQTDWVDSIDGETKLGQPMVQLRWSGDFGNLQSLYLPYFRERTFAGPHGRLRLPFSLDTEQPAYASRHKQHHPDFALRYTQQIDQIDVALSYFNGTSRDPMFIPSAAAWKIYYPQITQWGLEGQWVVDSWIWKLEAIRRADGNSHYYASNSGFEYTWVGLLDSAADLGFLFEYQFDSRGKMAPTPGQRDLFSGLRLALNDEASTELLMGIAQDLHYSNTRSGMLEASMRFSNNLRIRLEMWIFQSETPSQPFWWLRKDDFVQLGFDYYF